MADNFATLKKQELADKLVAAGVEVPADAQKADLVALAQQHLSDAPAASDAPTPPAADAPAAPVADVPAAPVVPPAAPVDLSTLSLADLGKKLSGRYEVVCLNPDAAESDRQFRVFAPEGQPATPVFTADRAGEAYRFKDDSNNWVRRAVGNTQFAKLSQAAVAAGYQA